jgi:tetratricopeptide (TPR) repeat protein
MPKKHFYRWPAVVWAAVLLAAIPLCGCSGTEEKRDKFLASGQAFFQQGDYVQARRQFQSALQVDPKFATAYLWMGKTELKLRNPQAAYDALNQAVGLNPDLTEAQILLGDILLLAREIGKAQEKADLALKREPNNSEALLLSAALALAQAQPQKAREVLAEVRRLDPGKVSAYLLEVSILVQERKPEEAANLLDQGLKANPKAWNLYTARADLADAQGHFEAGESFLLQAMALEPKNPQLFERLATHYTMAGQADKAEAALRQGVSLEPDREQPVIRLARLLVNQGRRPEAEKTLKDFIQAHPDNYPARFDLAELYVALRRYKQAETVLEEVIRQDSAGFSGIKARNELARLKLAQGQTDEAEKLVNEVLKDHPKDPGATEMRGLIALQKGDGPTAVNSFRLLTQERPQSPEAWLVLARAYLLNKEEDHAKEEARKALKLKPDFGEAQQFLYGIFLQAKDYDGAINTIQGYLDLNPKDAVNLISLGEVYALKGDDAKAGATFQRLIDLDAKNPQGYYRLARLKLKGDKPDEALKFAHQALQVQPDYLPALKLAVSLYQDRKQPEKSVAAVRRGVEHNPKNPELQQMLGELLIAQKQPQAAIAPLEAALSLNPQQGSAVQLLALAYQESPDADKALGQLADKAADPKSPPIFSLVLAAVYEQQKKFDELINLYESLLARNLFTSLARNYLAFLLAEHRPTAENLARAEKLAGENLEVNPEETSFLDTLGWVLGKQGKYAQAQAYLEKALHNDPDNPGILYHLAWCKAKQGETVWPRLALQKALASKTKFMERDAARKLLDSLPPGGK